MIIKISCSELYNYQQEAEQYLDAIKSLYTFYGDRLWRTFPWYKKFSTYFKFPPYLRMHHRVEYLVDLEDLSLLEKYRKIWHDYWWVAYGMEQVPDTNDQIYLDSFETSVILNLRQYR